MHVHERLTQESCDSHVRPPRKQSREIRSQQLSCLPTFAAVEFMLECVRERNLAS